MWLVGGLQLNRERGGRKIFVAAFLFFLKFPPNQQPCFAHDSA